MPATHRRLGLVVAPAIATLLAVGAPTPSYAADTGSISGVVTSRTAGAAAPYAGADVYVDRVDDGHHQPGIGAGESAANGSFTVGGLPDGTYEVRIYPDTYDGTLELGELGYEYYDDQWSPYGSTEIVISGGQARTLANPVELRPVGRITGRVLDEAGQPVDGNVNIGKDGQGGYGLRTDSQGYYDSIDGEWTDNLIPDDYVVDFSSADYSQSGPVYEWVSKPAAVTAGGTTVVDFTLVERPKVTFTVLGEDGAPQAYAPVGFQMRDGDGPWRSPQYGPITTDENGLFRITDDADDYKLWFRPEEGGTEVREYFSDDYSFADAEVVTFRGDVPLHRAHTIQLGGAPAITPGTPVISGTPQEGQTLTLAPGTWTPSGVSTSVEWFAADTPIGTGPEITLADGLADQWLWARVTGSAAGQKSVDVETQAVQITAGDPPVQYAVPSVSGTAAVGSTLTAVPGSWGDATLAYRWTADGAEVGTASTLDLTSAMAATKVAVRVTGSKPGHTSVSRTSAPVTVGQGTLTAATPTITGTAAAGSTLTAVPGAWGPAPVDLTYAWTIGGVPAGTAPTLAVTADMAGKQAVVEVTGTKAGYASATRQASVQVAAAEEPTPTPTPTPTPAPAITPGAPVVSGSASVGGTLVATTGAWGPAGVTLAHQWLADGVAIPGATASTYLPTNDVAGQRISVRVTGTLAGAAPASATSAATGAVVGQLDARRPSITGKLRVGNKLTAKTSGWGPGKVATKIQWLRDGKVVKGRKGATYRLTSQDVGHRMSVRVVGTRSSFAPLTLVSRPTRKVRA